MIAHSPWDRRGVAATTDHELRSASGGGAGPVGIEHSTYRVMIISKLLVLQEARNTSRLIVSARPVSMPLSLR